MHNMPEKFSLKWNDFHSNVSKSFTLSQNEGYLHDVTLVSDDHHQMSAHKLVLSSSSEYFKNIFKNMKNSSQTVLCLQGTNSGDLSNILEYVYNGEVQVFQDKLDHFLSIAHRLKLNGLTNVEDPGQHEEEIKMDNSATSMDSSKNTMAHTMAQILEETITSQETNYLSINDGDLEAIDEKIKQCIEKCPDGKFKCTVCGKIALQKPNLKKHIETHIEGLSIPCNNCHLSFRSRNSLYQHVSKEHRMK